MFFSYFWKYSLSGFFVLTGVTTSVFAINESIKKKNSISEPKILGETIKINDKQTKTKQQINPLEIKFLLSQKEELHKLKKEEYEKAKVDFEEVAGKFDTNLSSISSLLEKKSFSHKKLESIWNSKIKYDSIVNEIILNLHNNENWISSINNNIKNYDTILEHKNKQLNNLNVTKEKLKEKIQEFIDDDKKFQEELNSSQSNLEETSDTETNIDNNEDYDTKNKRLLKEITQTLKDTLIFNLKKNITDPTLLEERKKEIQNISIDESFQADFANLTLEEHTWYKENNSNITKLTAEIKEITNKKREAMNKKFSLIATKFQLYLKKIFYNFPKTIFTTSGKKIKQEIETLSTEIVKSQTENLQTLTSMNEKQKIMDNLEIKTEKLKVEVSVLKSQK